jgi:hypothetical protein
MAAEPPGIGPLVATDRTHDRDGTARRGFAFDLGPMIDEAFVEEPVRHLGLRFTTPA